MTRCPELPRIIKNDKTYSHRLLHAGWPAFAFPLEVFRHRSRISAPTLHYMMQGRGAGSVISSLYGESRYSHSSSTRRYSSSHRRDRSSHRCSHYRPSRPPLSLPSAYHPHLSALSLPTEMAGRQEDGLPKLLHKGRFNRSKSLTVH